MERATTRVPEMIVDMEGFLSQYNEDFDKWQKVIYNQMTDELDEILAWMGDVHSEAPESPVPYSSPRKRPRTVSFDDVIVHFSEEQWKALEDEQKEVYKKMLTETYNLLASLGSPIVKPEILLKLERGEEPCSQGGSKSKEDAVPEEHCTADQYIDYLNEKLNATRSGNPGALSTTRDGNQETLNPMRAGNPEPEKHSPGGKADDEPRCDPRLNGTKQQDRNTNLLNTTAAAGGSLADAGPFTRGEHIMHQRKETSGTGTAVKLEPQRRMSGEGKENLSPHVFTRTVGGGGWNANTNLMNPAMAHGGRFYNLHIATQGTQLYRGQVVGAGESHQNRVLGSNATPWTSTQMFFTKMNSTPLWQVNGAPLWQVNGAPLWQVNGAPLWQVNRNPTSLPGNRQDKGNLHRENIGEPNGGAEGNPRHKRKRRR